MAKTEFKTLRYIRVPLTVQVDGKLHATSPNTPPGQEYMLGHTPSPTQLAARRLAGELIVPLADLAAAVADEIPEKEEEPTQQLSVFRRDEAGRPFLHANFIKGHLRDAAETVGRMVGFWGLKGFVTTTLWISPYRTMLDGPVGIDEWPTHFDLYRKGRVSGFRRAEYVESPKLELGLVLLGDSRWNSELLTAVLFQGSMMGMGGGRRLEGGKYTFSLGDFEHITPVVAQGLLVAGAIKAG